MSQENVDLVRSIYANWERGDFSSAEWADREIEFVIADGPNAGSWKGLAGMAEGYRDFLNAWEGWTAEAEEFCELDGERVLVLSHFGGHGKTSGLELGTRMKGAELFHLRDGKVTRLVLYGAREDAFSDLGLSEQDAHADS
jgi:ketosteroid isomerase-like protein